MPGENDAPMGRQSPRRYALIATAVAALAVIIGLVGIRWGLPSYGRNALYFATPESMQESLALLPNAPGPKDQDPKSRIEPTTRSLYNPLRSYHPDEYYALKMLSRMRPGALDVDPEWYVIGGAYVYPLGASLKVSGIVGLVSLGHDTAWYLAHPDEMAKFYIVGRALTVLAALGATLLVMSAARRLWGDAAAIVAGLALALSPLLVMHQHFMYNDVPGMFWVALATWASARIMTGPRRVDFIVAGLAAGLAAGTKLHHGFVFVLVVAACLATRSGKAERVRGLALAIGLAALAFVITNPFYLLRPGPVMENYAKHVWAGSSFGFYVKTLGLGLGALPLACAAIGILIAAARRDKPALVIGLWLIAFYVVISLFGKQFARFAMPLLPAVALMVGSVAAKFGRRPVLLTACTIVILTPCVVTDWGILASLTREDSRTIAGRFIAEAIPAGATIAVTEEPWQFEVPPMDLARYRIVASGYSERAAADSSAKAFVYSDLECDSTVNVHPQTAEVAAFWGAIEKDRASGRYSTLYETPENLRWPKYYSGLSLWRNLPEDLRYLSPKVTILAIEQGTPGI